MDYHLPIVRDFIGIILFDILIFFTKDIDPILQSNSDGEGSLHIEHEQDENDQMPMPVVYKKRARIKFTQEQVEI
jgi:hypothetical protein